MSNQPETQKTDSASAASEVPFRYTPALAEQIELKWQDTWENQGTYYAANPSGKYTDAAGNHADPQAKPFFVMDMFPYPSGAGLHVGHPLGYIATDVVARYRRAQGDNVLHALGYDAFGLPAEQFAVQTGAHPRDTTVANIDIMRQQLRRLGLGHDSRRSFATIDDGYVRWTQWIFLQIFNSWYDDDAPARLGEGKGRARPIGELETEFASGSRPLPELEGVRGGVAWADLTSAEQGLVLDSYRLAYISHTPVNWCPGLGTVLANEEVTSEGKSERGNFPVFQRSLRQWNMRITAYAERLVGDLEYIDWPEKVKSMQRNWIGKSEGAYVDFAVAGVDEPITVYTTRPDTLFGASYVVLAPEHELVDQLLANAPTQWADDTPQSWRGEGGSPAESVAAYQRYTSRRSAVERQADSANKTGVFTGSYATNPVTGQQLPVFIADYVLAGYGTGAIMAVPGGDQRDYEFAQAFDLPVIYTVAPPADFAGEAAWTGEGLVINSQSTDLDLNGLAVEEAKSRITDWLEAHEVGTRAVNYRLRDWLFSRQRYWGEPFPIVYDADDRAIALPESHLPVLLPDVPDYAPRTFDPLDADSQPEAPLGRNEDWVNVELDFGDGPQTYRRDTNTMPNWAGSCWYQLRYLDPTSEDLLVAPELENYWMGPGHNGNPEDQVGGVDLYIGGVEHAVLHLLYARFWHKVLYDLGHVSGAEPYQRLFNQGYIQAYAYTDERGVYVPAAEVTEHEENGQTVFRYQGELVNREYGKIGKSLKNSVSPDEMYEQYGADTLRVYEMSMGPLDLSRPWETRAVVGSQRFLQRIWRNAVDEETGDLLITDEPADEATLKVLHKSIAAVREDMDNMRFNTAIAGLIVLNNHLTGLERTPRDAFEPLVKMLAPIAPHLAEELWARLGHTDSVVYAPYPEVDERYLVEDLVTCVLQVQGKVRSRIEVSPNISAAELEALALADPGLQRALDGREIRLIIVREPKIVNVVPK